MPDCLTNSDLERPSATRPRGRVVGGLLLLTIVLVSCGHDAADREYLAALQGDDVGAPVSESLAHVNRAIALAPERPAYWETRAGYHNGMGDLAAAEADLDRAIQLADRPYLRFARGLVRCKRKRLVDALSDLDSAIAAQPANTQFYRGRALARAEAGMPERALEDGEHLVAKEPQHSDSYYARGVALAKLGRTQEALADLDHSLLLRPEIVYPLFARADCNEKLGDAARAAADREEATRRTREGSGCGYCLDPFHQ